MTIEEMRLYVSKQYPSESWAEKVKRMPDYQVYAIFRSMQKREIKNHEGYEQLRMDI